MSDLKEQGFCTKILFQFGKKKMYTDTFEMMNVAFGGYTMVRINVFEWFSKLKNCVTSFEHAEIRDL
jgi:hypothetical protein